MRRAVWIKFQVIRVLTLVVLRPFLHHACPQPSFYEPSLPQAANHYLTTELALLDLAPGNALLAGPWWLALALDQTHEHRRSTLMCERDEVGGKSCKRIWPKGSQKQRRRLLDPAAIPPSPYLRQKEHHVSLNKCYSTTSIAPAFQNSSRQILKNVFCWPANDSLSSEGYYSWSVLVLGCHLSNNT